MFRIDIERQKQQIIRFVYWALVIGLAYTFLKYVMPTLMPFILGFLIVAVLRAPAAFLARITKWNQKWITVILLLMFFAFATTTLVLVGARLAGIIGDFILIIPDFYLDTIEPAFWQAFEFATAILEELDPSQRTTIQSVAGNVLSTLANMVMSFSTTAFNRLTGLAGELPMVIIDSIVTLISSFFIALDYPLIKEFILRQFKPEHVQFASLIKVNTLRVISNYIKAYLLLMLINYAQMLVGLWLIGVGSFALVALGISIFDLLPVLGTGGILVPWAIIDLLTGQVARAVKVLVLYGIVTFIRNFLEPKIVGQRIGLHPLLTLLGMYVGASLFGFIGFLAVPVLSVVIKDLNDNGTVNLFK